MYFFNFRVQMGKLQSLSHYFSHFESPRIATRFTGNTHDSTFEQLEGGEGASIRRTFGADEAPADVDVLVVLAALARHEVVRTQEAVVCQHQAASCHAVVIGVIGHGAANAPSQAACQGEEKKKRKKKKSG